MNHVKHLLHNRVGYSRMSSSNIEKKYLKDSVSNPKSAISCQDTYFFLGE